MHSSTVSLTSALYGGGWSTPHPDHLTSGKDPVPILQEAGWVPGSGWTVAEDVAPTGIRFRTVQPVVNRYNDSLERRYPNKS